MEIVESLKRRLKILSALFYNRIFIFLNSKFTFSEKSNFCELCLHFSSLKYLFIRVLDIVLKGSIYKIYPGRTP